MKADELGQRTSFLLLWNWLQWGDSLRGEVSNVSPIASARAAGQIQGACNDAFPRRDHVEPPPSHLRHVVVDGR